MKKLKMKIIKKISKLVRKEFEKEMEVEYAGHIAVLEMDVANLRRDLVAVRNLIDCYVNPPLNEEPEVREND